MKILSRLTCGAVLAAAMMSPTLYATSASAVEFTVDLYFIEVSHEICFTNKETGVKTCQWVDTSEAA